MSEHSDAQAALHAENPDPQGTSTMVVGIAGVLVTIVILIALEVLYYKTAGHEFTRKEVESVSVDLEAMRVEQQRQLESYRWIDKTSGVVGLPIERAMQLVVEEHGKP